MRLPFLFPSLALWLAIGLGQSNSEDSLEKYRKELGTNPSSSLAHYRMGEIFYQQQNHQAASNEFREALNGDLQPPWIETNSHLMLATIYNLHGQYDRAQNEYRFALSVNRNPPNPPPLGTYLVGPGVVAPQPIQKIEPEYTEEARAAGLEGFVELSGTITEQGFPKDMHVTGPLGFGLDEKALEAIAQWRFQPGTLDGQPVPVYTNVLIDFHLSSKQSRWHMIRAEFDPPAGVVRPQFLRTIYPRGAGISASAAEEGWVLTAVGRQATATIAFAVNERGAPVGFRVLNSSAPVWGNEAISVVRDWQFVPAAKSGMPTSVPCTIDLVWGARNLTSESFRWAVTQLNAPMFPMDSAAASAPPSLIYTYEPVYTDEARNAGVEGTVVLRLVVGGDGIPENVNIVTGLGRGLDERAVEAVRQWRFEPTLVNGLPIRVPTTVEVNFKLPSTRPKHRPQ